MNMFHKGIIMEKSDILSLNKILKPSEDLKNIYRAYTSSFSIIPIIATIISFYVADMSLALIVSVIFWIVFLLPTSFVFLWIEKYYPTISFELRESEIVVREGVWFKNVYTVPYRQITNVTTKQGPIYRHFGLGKVEIQTAGHSATGGGFSSEKPEASIFGVERFEEIRDIIIDIVKGSKSTRIETEQGVKRDESLDFEILEELRKIRKVLEDFQQNA